MARRSLVLRFSYDPRIYRAYVSYLPKLLARFPHLSSVSLAGSTLPDSALSRLRDFGSSLRSLSLYSCFGITCIGLTLVFEGCRHLISVTLDRCNITDTGLENLANFCQEVSSINLSYCMLISDHGINALCRRCFKLHALMISYYKVLTGTGFKGCPSTLTCLVADSCLLTPEGALEVVSGGGLEYLDMSNIGPFDCIDSLKGIGAGFARKLRILYLRMCRFVGDESVAAIAKGCPLIENWSLAGCHEIRTIGWAAIGSDCKTLKILHVNRCRSM